MERARAEGKIVKPAIYWFDPGYDRGLDIGRIRREEVTPPRRPPPPGGESPSYNPPTPVHSFSSSEADGEDESEDDAPLDFVPDPTFSPNATRNMTLDLNLSILSEAEDKRNLLYSLNDASFPRLFSQLSLHLNSFQFALKMYCMTFISNFLLFFPHTYLSKLPKLFLFTFYI